MTQRKPKQLEEVWKSDIRVNNRLGTVLDSFASSHGADSAMPEAMICQDCGSTSDATGCNPDDHKDISCSTCHSHNVIITQVRLFTSAD